ncbi:MAG: hypothetical protein IT290_01000 [Deltaproteobacteria bacterium]|nr:hypothetical protein [Deltaproteobacteria bacterium]
MKLPILDFDEFGQPLPPIGPMGLWFSAILLGLTGLIIYGLATPPSLSLRAVALCICCQALSNWVVGGFFAAAEHFARRPLDEPFRAPPRADLTGVLVCRMLRPILIGPVDSMAHCSFFFLPIVLLDGGIFSIIIASFLAALVIRSKPKGFLMTFVGFTFCALEVLPYGFWSFLFGIVAMETIGGLVLKLRERLEE